MECGREAWGSNMILLEAMLYLSVALRKQSMQMSALGYPDEVCMIPEEE